MGFTHRLVRSSSGRWPCGCPRSLMVAGCGWSRAEQSQDSESPADGRRASWGHSGSRPLPACAYGHSSAARGSWSESPPGAGAGRSRRDPGAPGGGATGRSEVGGAITRCRARLRVQGPTALPPLRSAVSRAARAAQPPPRLHCPAPFLPRVPRPGALSVALLALTRTPPPSRRGRRPSLAFAAVSSRP